jgi:hypothetical protein
LTRLRAFVFCGGSELVGVARDVFLRKGSGVRNNLHHPLPKNGAVCEQWIRCGKVSCFCARGERRHGPYAYWFGREGGKQVKRYVRLDQAADARASVSAARAVRQEARLQARQARDHWRVLLAALRSLERPHD